MSEARLDAALSRGLIPAPRDLRVLVVGAADGSAAAQAYPLATFIQPLEPDHDRLASAGCAVQPGFPGEAEASFDLALIVLPRARARAHDWLAQAAARLRPGGLLAVDGAKTDGVDALWRALRGRLEDTDSATKAHGRLFAGRVGADRLADLAAPPAEAAPGFRTAPGVFSADGIDPGSAVLAAALPARLPPRIADLGAGWGWLSAQILARDGVQSLALVEADHAALCAARANVTDPRASFYWADATAWRPPAPLDAVVMNPPFHTVRAADAGLGRAFIAAAAAQLGPQGQLWLVANRHLPYEAALESLFRDWTEAEGGSRAFKILHASRPRQNRKGTAR